MLFDLHVHTRLSQCSNLSLDDIIDHAPKLGLDGVCITDHHNVRARDLLSARQSTNGLCILVGMEYRTSDGDFLIFGPLNQLEPGMSARQLLTKVKARGGAAVAAHPFRKEARTSEFVVREELCRIVESFNGRNSLEENIRVSQWRRSYDLIECAGSDAHSLPELGRLKTRFNVPIHCVEDLVQALNRGQCAPVIDHQPA